MNKTALRPLYVVSAWLCAIAAIHLGIIGLLGRDMVQELLMRLNLGMLYVPLHYVFGIAGIIVLIGLIQEAMNPHCGTK